MAKLDISGLDDWKSSISRNSRNTPAMGMGAKLVATSALGNVFIDAILDKNGQQEDWFGVVLRKFVTEQITGRTGAFFKQFYSKVSTGSEYWPMYIPKEGGAPEAKGVFQVNTDDDERRASIEDSMKAAHMRKQKTLRSGFDAIWSILRRDPVIRVEGNSVVAGIGDRQALNRLQLSSYTGGGGGSKYNNLFLATEYGTGIASNVGGPEWVRRSGPTKATAPFEEGSWWFTNKDAEDEDGSLFLGQKGVHFLYDARSRKPLALYQKLFRDELPKYIRRELNGGSAVKATMF